MNEILKTKYRVDGMDCASCASKIDTAARRTDGIEDVSVSVTAGTMTVSHAPSADLAKMEKRISGLGYSLFPFPKTVKAEAKPEHLHQLGDHDHGHSHDHNSDSHDHDHDHDHDHSHPHEQPDGSQRDLVCGMTVPPDSRYFELYEGRTYRFCSEKCLTKFRAAPVHYLREGLK